MNSEQIFHIIWLLFIIGYIIQYFVNKKSSDKEQQQQSHTEAEQQQVTDATTASSVGTQSATKHTAHTFTTTSDSTSVIDVDAFDARKKATTTDNKTQRNFVYKGQIFIIKKHLLNAFNRIDVEPDISLADLNKIKRKLLKKYHPDMATSMFQAAENEKRSQQINSDIDLIEAFIRERDAS